jgi:cytochrome c556
MRYGVAFAIAVFGLTVQFAGASAQEPLVTLVLDRQILMLDMQSSWWPLFDLNSGKRTDLEAVPESVAEITAALDRLPAMFPPGTARGEVPGSRATPDIWNAPADFEAAILTLREALAELETVAAGGDIEAFRAQFAETDAACFACHVFRPSGGGRFRFARE